MKQYRLKKDYWYIYRNLPYQFHKDDIVEYDDLVKGYYSINRKVIDANHPVTLVLIKKTDVENNLDYFEEVKEDEIKLRKFLDECDAIYSKEKSDKIVYECKSLEEFEELQSICREYLQMLPPTYYGKTKELYKYKDKVILLTYSAEKKEELVIDKVGYGNQETTKIWAKKLGFDILSDTEREIIKAYRTAKDLGWAVRKIIVTNGGIIIEEKNGIAITGATITGGNKFGAEIIL